MNPYGASNEEAQALYVFIGLLLVLIDQLTKYWVQKAIPLWDSIPIIPKVFHLTHVHNPGAAFSLFAHKKWFFIVTALIAALTTFVLRKAIAKQEPVFKWGVTLALAGAAGNFIDRMRLNVVVDFFDFQIWPVFNIADICIVVGVSILIWTILRRDVFGIRS